MIICQMTILPNRWEDCHLANWHLAECQGITISP